MTSFKEVSAIIFQSQGSIIPVATCIALPCGVLSTILKYMEVNRVAGADLVLGELVIKGTAYSSFSSLLGFLVVFRTSQAYSRYFAGGGLLPLMVGTWWTAVSSLFAYCRTSKAKPEEVMRLQHVVARLVSLLSALALVELEGAEEGEEEEFLQRLDQLKIIDSESLDSNTLAVLRNSELKIELVFNWIQVVLVDAINRGIINIPPPILGRVFLALASGMVKFHDSMKLAILPFPFPYSQATLALLMFHWCLTPFMICAETAYPIMAGFWAFLIVFIFWGLNTIALELENPFGDDPNDIDAISVQNDMNAKLLLLARGECQGRPGLDASLSEDDLALNAATRVSTLKSVWTGQARAPTICTNRGSQIRRQSLSSSEMLTT